MIPFQELRIGNYVLVRASIQRISLISNDDSYSATPAIAVGNDPSGKKEICAGDAVQPIPLADVILQQCGFVFREHFKFWQLVDSSANVRTEIDVDTDYNLIDFMRKPVVKKLTSLHQLQNLYFALKGKELDFLPTS